MSVWGPEGIWQCRGCGQTYVEYVNGCPKHDDGERAVVLRVSESEIGASE